MPSPSPFETALGASLAALHQFAAVPVTYRRGAASVELTAVRGSTESQEIDEQGGLVTVRLRDYLIFAEALVLGGQVVPPRVGDVIEDGPLQCRVLPDGPEPAARHTGPDGTQWRIHTKIVSEA
jgi:hypothetical protein